MEQRRSREEQRAALAELERRHRRYRPRSIAVRHHQAARPQAIERADERVLADRVVDHVDPAVRRCSFRLRNPILARQHDVVRAELARPLCLRCRADHRDHFRAEMLGPLHENRADSSDRRVHEQRVALAHAIGLPQQHLRGHALQHECRGLVVADALGNAHEALGRQHTRFAVRAGRVECVRDAIAGLELADAGANGLDDAGRLATEHSRELRWIQARALVDVDEVQPDRRMAHPRLTGAGLGHVDRIPAQDFRAAVGMNTHRMSHAVHVN